VRYGWSTSAIRSGASSQAAVRRLELDDVKVTHVVDGVMLVLAEAFFPTVPSYFTDGPRLGNRGVRAR
jgi:hypothetical protein